MKILNKVKISLKKIRAFFLANRLLFKVNNTKMNIKSEYQKNNVINVMFLVQFPEMWNSFRTVYESMKNDSTFSVSIVCIPKKNGVPTKTIEFTENNDAFDFCKKNGYSCKKYVPGNTIESYINKASYVFVDRKSVV